MPHMAQEIVPSLNWNHLRSEMCAPQLALPCSPLLKLK
jgi:hypothetical protein